MAEKAFQEKMTETIIELLGIMGVEGARVDVSPMRGSVGESLMFSITVDRNDSKMLIGQHGVALFSFQHLLQMIARRRHGNTIEFSVDVNRYWKEKCVHLRRDAEETAHTVVATGRPVSMRPMLPHERKVIHAVLAGNVRVETGSVGKGEERKVIVKPKAVFS
jgi:spoIIIJ-associated protein